MEEELRYAPLTFRNPMMSKLRNYRKDLAKLHREVRSTPLTATPGGRGDVKYGAYALENEHLVSGKHLVRMNSGSDIPHKGLWYTN